MINKLTSVVIAIVGFAMLYMGGKLLLLGGTPFYVIMAIGLLITAVALFKNKTMALSIYAILMWLVLAWMIYEVGFDKWQWIPRGDLIGLIGFWLAMPWVVAPLTKAQKPGKSGKISSFSRYHRHHHDRHCDWPDVLRSLPTGWKYHQSAYPGC